uniref:Small ribosomal subunit protein uS2m n=1 Tax=Aceria tosichella TaxID=561515 RepID=A0A6G1SBN6_9ACAR
MASILFRTLPRRCLHTATSAAANKSFAAQTVMSATITPPIQEISKLEPPPISSLQQGDFFNLKSLFTMEDLVESRVHFGHKDGMLDPYMRPYIFGKRLGVLIFDLERTTKLLNQALLVAAEIAYRKGIILFVNQSRQTGHLAEAAAKECGEYAYCRRWTNKILSDAQQTFNSVTRLPDLIILLSVVEKVNELHEAVTMSAKMLIPTVGICDTNADPTLVTYPVPGNDDTPQSIELYCKLFKQAILNGKQKRDEIIEMYGLDYYDKTLRA